MNNNDKQLLRSKAVEEDIARLWAEYRENPAPNMSFDSYLRWQLTKTNIKLDKLWDLNLMIS